jgi:hypothetical protein
MNSINAIGRHIIIYINLLIYYNGYQLINFI